MTTDKKHRDELKKMGFTYTGALVHPTVVRAWKILTSTLNADYNISKRQAFGTALMAFAQLPPEQAAALVQKYARLPTGPAGGPLDILNSAIQGLEEGLDGAVLADELMKAARLLKKGTS